MPLSFWHAFVRGLFPEHAAIAFVETPDLEGLFVGVVHRRNVTVQTDFQILVAALADRRGHEHAISPDDRAGQSQPRDWRFPFWCGPFFRSSRAVSHSTGLPAAELRPVKVGRLGAANFICRGELKEKRHD